MLKKSIKNAALYYLAQLRKERKNSTLTAILERLGQKAKRKKHQDMELKKQLSKMSLVKRLETI